MAQFPTQHKMQGEERRATLTLEPKPVSNSQQKKREWRDAKDAFVNPERFKRFWIISNYPFKRWPKLALAQAEFARLSREFPARPFRIYRCSLDLEHGWSWQRVNDLETAIAAALALLPDSEASRILRCALETPEGREEGGAS